MMPTPINPNDYPSNIPAKIAQIQFVNGVWTDVTDTLMHELKVNRGSSRIESPIIRYEPGTATIRLNNTDRRYDPTNIADGPYSDGVTSQIIPNRPIRIFMRWNNVTYPFFRGYIDQWNVTWISDIFSQALVTATDGFKLLANKKRVAGALVGDGENSGARVSRILDSADWPLADRNIATGSSLLQATDLSGSALDELQLVAQSEVGEIYIAVDGRANVRNRHAQVTETRSTISQGSFGTHIGIPAPFEVDLNTDDTTLWNEVIATVKGGTAQTASDVQSIALYGGISKTLQQSNLYLQEDIVALSYAEWVLYISKDAEVRFDAITIYPMRDPDLYFPQVLSREIGDRITVTYRPSGGGQPITRDAFIRGIKHDVGQQKWATTWLLQSATKFVGNFLTLDHPVLGVLDNGNLYGY